MDQKTHDPEQNRSAQLGSWAQSLQAKAGRVRSALSPWVQRLLAAGRSDAGTAPPEAAIGIVQRQPTAFSERHTRVLLDRVFRQMEGSRVGRPAVGSAAPRSLGGAFDRFAGDIMQRQLPVAGRYLAQPPEEGSESKSELVLASSGPVGAGTSSEAAHLEPWLPSQMPESFPPPMPTPAEPPPWLQPPKTVQRRDIRPVSRIEEITPGSKGSTLVATEPSLTPGAETEGAGEEGMEGRATPPEAPAVAGKETSTLQRWEIEEPPTLPLPEAELPMPSPPAMVKARPPEAGKGAGTSQRKVEEVPSRQVEPPARLEAPPIRRKVEEVSPRQVEPPGRLEVPPVQREAEEAPWPGVERIVREPQAMAETHPPAGKGTDTLEPLTRPEGKPVQPKVPPVTSKGSGTLQRRVEEVPPRQVEPPAHPEAPPVRRWLEEAPLLAGKGAGTSQRKVEEVPPPEVERPTPPLAEAHLPAGEGAGTLQRKVEEVPPPEVERPTPPLAEARTLADTGTGTSQRKVEEIPPSEVERPTPPLAETRPLELPARPEAPPLVGKGAAVLASKGTGTSQRKVEEIPPPEVERPTLPLAEARPLELPARPEAPPLAGEGAGTLRRKMEEIQPPKVERSTPPLAEARPLELPARPEAPPPAGKGAGTSQRKVEDVPPPEVEHPTPPLAGARPPTGKGTGTLELPARPVAPPVQRQVQEAPPAVGTGAGTSQREVEEVSPPEAERPTPPLAEARPPAGKGAGTLEPPTRPEGEPAHPEALPVAGEGTGISQRKVEGAPLPQVEPPARAERGPQARAEARLPELPARLEAPPVPRRVEEAPLVASKGAGTLQRKVVESPPPEVDLPVRAGRGPQAKAGPQPPAGEGTGTLEPSAWSKEEPARPEVPPVQGATEEALSFEVGHAMPPLAEVRPLELPARPEAPPVAAGGSGTLQRKVEEAPLLGAEPPAPVEREPQARAEARPPAGKGAGTLQPPARPEVSLAAGKGSGTLQRKVEEAPLPEVEPPTRAEARPSAGKGAGTSEPSARPELSPIQELPLSEVERPALPSAGGHPEAPPRVQRQAELGHDVLAPGLDQEVAVRAAAKERMPLTEPLRPASRVEPDAASSLLERGVPRMPQARIQAQFEGAETTAVSVERPTPDRFRPLSPAGGELPLRQPSPEVARVPSAGPNWPQALVPDRLPLPISRLASPGLVERQPAAMPLDLALPRPAIQIVQRAEEAGPPTAAVAGQGEEKPKLNLDDLARQVYPLIKRMLAVERERRLSR